MRAARMSEAVRAELARQTRVVAIPGDVTEATHRRALADAALLLGGLDAIVNSASTLGPSPLPPLLDYPLDALEQVFARTSSHRWGCCRPCAAVTPRRAHPQHHQRRWGRGLRGLGRLTAPARRRSSNSPCPRGGASRVACLLGRSRRHAYRNAPSSVPGVDISDRPLPDESVPGLIDLLTGDLPSGRYQARSLGGEAHSPKGRARATGRADR